MKKFSILFAMFIILIITLFSFDFKSTSEYAFALIAGFYIWVMGIWVYKLSEM